MKYLVIVESPAKASKIQEYLGKDYIVKASYGHIADLAKGGKHGIGIDIANNFKPKYILLEDKVGVVDELLSIGKHCDIIYLSSDPDREGESISWHLSQRLADLNKPFKRVVFNEIKKDKILKAIQNAGEINMNAVHSQEGRRFLDRIVGFTVSPFLMAKYNTTLSGGRVQSVVSKMVIDREKEIEVFVPEDYWTIQVSLQKDNQQFITKYAGQLKDLDKANEAKLALNHPDYVISEVIAEEEKKSPQSPLITSSLQRLMSKNHSISSENTMKAAQSLYENGYITYHRTDSVRIGDEPLKELREYLKDNNLPSPKKAHIYKNKDATQDAHEAIRPVDLSLHPDSNYSMVDKTEKLVYEMIWRYFVSSQMTPAIYNTLKITANPQNSKLEVKTSGKALKTKGYLEVMNTSASTEEKIDIPNLNKGDIVKLISNNPIKMEKKQTQPLPRYSEDKLIKELVNKNIGRPSTYATLLSTITNRNYVEKRGNVYHATKLGKEISDILTKYFSFMDYNFSSELEKKLDDIESGKLNYLDMLNNFYPPYKKELDKAYIDQGGSLCQKCQSPMSILKNKKTQQKFLACNNVKCRNTQSLKESNI